MDTLIQEDFQDLNNKTKIKETKEKRNTEANYDCRREWVEFECKVCKKDCKRLEDLDSHMESRHAKFIKCGICDINFQEIFEMNIHMNKEHDGSGILNDPGVLREVEMPEYDMIQKKVI